MKARKTEIEWVETAAEWDTKDRVFYAVKPGTNKAYGMIQCFSDSGFCLLYQKGLRELCDSAKTLDQAKRKIQRFVDSGEWTERGSVVI